MECIWIGKHPSLLSSTPRSDHPTASIGTGVTATPPSPARQPHGRRPQPPPRRADPSPTHPHSLRSPDPPPRPWPPCASARVATASAMVAAAASCRSPLTWLFALAAALFFASWYLLLDSAAGGPAAARPYLGGGGLRPGPGRKCDPAGALLRVFMYDLPPEFHFGLLDWKPPGFGGGVWPDVRGGGGVPEYPGGLNLQHSIEYWLTLDLLASEQGAPTPCAAVRVPRAADADVVFVPFFASLSFNRHSRVVPPARDSEDRALQRRLLEFLAARPEWRRAGGRDHVVLAHHPNGMLDARYRLWPCIFVLCDFGRYPRSVANLDKDVIAPYRHVVANFANDTAGYNDRPTLLYFQGAIYRKDVSTLHSSCN